jgi:hypothetical protein
LPQTILCYISDPWVNHVRIGVGANAGFKMSGFRIFLLATESASLNLGVEDSEDQGISDSQNWVYWATSKTCCENYTTNNIFRSLKWDGSWKGEECLLAKKETALKIQIRKLDDSVNSLFLNSFWGLWLTTDCGVFLGVWEHGKGKDQNGRKNLVLRTISTCASYLSFWFG